MQHAVGLRANMHFDAAVYWLMGQGSGAWVQAPGPRLSNARLGGKYAQTDEHVRNLETIEIPSGSTLLQLQCVGACIGL